MLAHVLAPGTERFICLGAVESRFTADQQEHCQLVWTVSVGAPALDFTYTQDLAAPVGQTIKNEQDLYNVLLAHATSTSSTGAPVQFSSAVTRQALISGFSDLQTTLRAMNVGTASACLQNTWRQNFGGDVVVDGLSWVAVTLQEAVFDSLPAGQRPADAEAQIAMTLRTDLFVNERARLISEVLWKSFGMDVQSIATFLYNHLAASPTPDISKLMAPADTPTIMGSVPGNPWNKGQLQNCLQNVINGGVSVIEGRLRNILPLGSL